MSSPVKPEVTRAPSEGGVRSITSHDVARAAGVSQSTVSRVLRNDSRVTSGTRERVLAAVAELGYVPSDVGRSLVTRSTRTIAIVITDLGNVFYPHLVAPLHDEAWAQNYRIVLLTEEVEPVAGDAVLGLDEPSEDELTPLLDRLLDRSTDGVVLTTSRLDGVVPRELARRAIPFVFLTRYVEGVAADSAVRRQLAGRLAGRRARRCAWATPALPRSSAPPTPAPAAIASAACAPRWPRRDRSARQRRTSRPRSPTPPATGR